jgi:hypothetical protein
MSKHPLIPMFVPRAGNCPFALVRLPGFDARGSGHLVTVPEAIPPDPQVKTLVDALKRADVKGDCSVCGHNEWVPFHGLVRIPAVGGAGGMPALAIACQHCANVRFHLADVLEQYLAPSLAT